MTDQVQNVYGAFPLEDERPRQLYPVRPVLPTAPTAVEVNLGLTRLVRRYYHQFVGTCVGQSSCQAMTFYNGRLYDVGWVFHAAGGDTRYGVHTDALLDTMRRAGNVVVPPPYPARANEERVYGVPDSQEGIREFRWLSSGGSMALDDVRTCLSLRMPVLFVFPVYSLRSVEGRSFFDVPATPSAAGWHQILLTYASDGERVIGSPNSWGDGPLYCFTYDDFVKIVDVHRSYGAVITDLVSGSEGAQPDDLPPAPVPPQPVPPNPQPVEGYPCFFCSKVLPTERKRRRHVRRKHKKRRRPRDDSP